jgi:hypothetical protein
MESGGDELIAMTETDEDDDYEFAVPPFCDYGYWVLLVESSLPKGATLTTGNLIGQIPNPKPF